MKGGQGGLKSRAGGGAQSVVRLGLHQQDGWAQSNLESLSPGQRDAMGGWIGRAEWRQGAMGRPCISQTGAGGEEGRVRGLCKQKRWMGLGERGDRRVRER